MRLTVPGAKSEGVLGIPGVIRKRPHDNALPLILSLSAVVLRACDVPASRAWGGRACDSGRRTRSVGGCQARTACRRTCGCQHHSLIAARGECTMRPQQEP